MHCYIVRGLYTFEDNSSLFLRSLWSRRCPKSENNKITTTKYEFHNTSQNVTNECALVSLSLNDYYCVLNISMHTPFIYAMKRYRQNFNNSFFFASVCIRFATHTTIITKLKLFCPVKCVCIL